MASTCSLVALRVTENRILCSGRGSGPARDPARSCSPGAAARGGGGPLAPDSPDAPRARRAEAAGGVDRPGAANPAGSSVAISYDAVVSPVSTAVTNTGVASVIFTVEWDI